MDTDGLLDWLRAQLPPGSAAALRPIGGPQPPLFPEEAALIPRAGDKRRREFAAGRAAARAALLAIGYPPAALLAHPEGNPAWPAAVVGSIAHNDQWALAVVAAADRLSGLGVDLESDAPLPVDLAAAIRHPEEREAPPELAALDAAKLRFVAKEAFIKAVFPSGRRPIPFAAVAVELMPDGFRARQVEGRESGAGVFRCADGLICALATLARPERPNQ